MIKLHFSSLNFIVILIIVAARREFFFSVKAYITQIKESAT